MKTKYVSIVELENDVDQKYRILCGDGLDYSPDADKIEFAYKANFTRAKDLLVYFIVQGRTEFTERDCLLVASMNGSLKVVRETINFLLDICALEILGDDNGERIFEIDLSRKAIAL